MQTINLDKKDYSIEVARNVSRDKEAIRIIVPIFMPNNAAFDIVRVCIESVIKFTIEPYELWVVDNCSPSKFTKEILKMKDVNFVLNTTEPIPLPTKEPKFYNFFNFFKLKATSHRQIRYGSYANAIGLELGCRCISPDTQLVFTMHSDCLVTKKGWLSFMCSKMDKKIRAVGCRQDDARVKALHILGLLFDFTLFNALNMSFLHNINQVRTKAYPAYDVGDMITIRLQENNYGFFLCKNNYNNPRLRAEIRDNALRHLPIDCCLDDANDVFYLHLGRGTSKSIGNYNKPGKMGSAEWLELAKKMITPSG